MIYKRYVSNGFSIPISFVSRVRLTLHFPCDFQDYYNKLKTPRSTKSPHYCITVPYMRTITCTQESKWTRAITNPCGCALYSIRSFLSKSFFFITFLLHSVCVFVCLRCWFRRRCSLILMMAFLLLSFGTLPCVMFWMSSVRWSTMVWMGNGHVFISELLLFYWFTRSRAELEVKLGVWLVDRLLVIRAVYISGKMVCFMFCVGGMLFLRVCVAAVWIMVLQALFRRSLSFRLFKASCLPISTDFHFCVFYRYQNSSVFKI